MMIAGQSFRPLGYSASQLHRIIVIAGKFSLLHCMRKFCLDFTRNLGAFQPLARQFKLCLRLLG